MSPERRPSSRSILLPSYVTLRVEWQLYADVGDSNAGEFDVDLYSVGLLFRF